MLNHPLYNRNWICSQEGKKGVAPTYIPAGKRKLCLYSSVSVFTARCYTERGVATVCRLSVCLSVCLSVTFRYRDHISWHSLKIISRPNSLRLLLGLTPTCVIWCYGNTPKIRVESGWGHSGAHAISPKRCKIGPRLTYYDGLMGSRIRAFDWYKNQWPRMTLNGVSRDGPKFVWGPGPPCYLRNW